MLKNININYDKLQVDAEVYSQLFVVDGAKTDMEHIYEDEFYLPCIEKNS